LDVGDETAVPIDHVRVHGMVDQQDEILPGVALEARLVRVH